MDGQIYDNDLHRLVSGVLSGAAQELKHGGQQASLDAARNKTQLDARHKDQATVVSGFNRGYEAGEKSADLAESSPDLDKEQVERVLEEAQKQLDEKGVEMKFAVREDSGDLQVSLIDTANDKIVLKIPSDEVLKLSASIKEMHESEKAGAFLNRAV